VRNGFLLAAVAAAFALIAAPARADLKITVPATMSGSSIYVPYTYTGPAGLVRLELRSPGATEFKSSGIWPVSASGTVGTFIIPWQFGVVEGDWTVRVVASYGGDDALEVAEATTRLEWVADFAVAAPVFDPIEIGVTSGEKRLRVENTLGGPLRIKRVHPAPGSELAVVDDGCAGVREIGVDRRNAGTALGRRHFVEPVEKW